MNFLGQGYWFGNPTAQDIERVDWNSTPIDMEKQKEQLISDFQYMQERVAAF